MSDPDALLVGQMPDELASAVARLRDQRRREAIVGWRELGVAGRLRCTDFIEKSQFGWSRRFRAEIVVRRLGTTSAIRGS